VTLSGNGTEAVIVRVLHDASGVEAVGQFQAIETTPVDLDPIITDLNQLEADLDTLENTTLPALQSDLDTLENTTIPQLQQELDDILPITETDISDNAISTPKLQANSIVAGKIGAGAVTAGTIDAGAVTAGTIATDAVTTNTIDAGAITSLKIGAGEVKAINIEANAVTANKLNVGTLDAITANTGTLTSNLIRTAASGQRLELTDPGTDGTYSIWIGDSTKNDSNAVFYVKHDGEAFINKNEFDISDGGVTTGAFANSGTALVDLNSNGLEAYSGAITVGTGGIAFEVNLFYQATKSESQVAASSCILPGVSGTVEVQRSNNASFTSGVTTVNNITFDAYGSRVYIEEVDPSQAPGNCLQQMRFDNTKTFVDNPPKGTYYYRVIYPTWQSTFDTPEVIQNVLYATFTASAA